MEQAQSVANDAGSVSAPVRAYVRRVVTPAAREAYRQVIPLLAQLTSDSAENNTLRASAAALDSRLGSQVADEIITSLAGGSRVAPERSTQKALQELAGLKTRLATVSWKSSKSQLDAATKAIEHLEAVLAWDTVAPQVVRS